MKYSYLWLIGFAVASYLIGSINNALMISKIKKTDIRKVGSGNPGTLNMSRNLGIKLGLLTFLLDILKGALPCLIAYFVFRNKYFESTDFMISDLAIYICGLSVIFGHIFPIFLHFKGGKGIASSVGVLLVCEAVHGLSVIVFIVSLVSAILFVYFTEYGGMGSFIAITPPIISEIIGLYVRYSSFGFPTVWFLVFADGLLFVQFLSTWIAHNKNIARMLKGEEHPTSIKQMIKKSKEKKLQKEN